MIKEKKMGLKIRFQQTIATSTVAGKPPPTDGTVESWALLSEWESIRVWVKRAWVRILQRGKLGNWEFRKTGGLYVVLGFLLWNETEVWDKNHDFISVGNSGKTSFVINADVIRQHCSNLQVDSMWVVTAIWLVFVSFLPLKIRN